jgi:hypothetical protein
MDADQFPLPGYQSLSFTTRSNSQGGGSVSMSDQVFHSKFVKSNLFLLKNFMNQSLLN